MQVVVFKMEQIYELVLVAIQPRTIRQLTEKGIANVFRQVPRCNAKHFYFGSHDVIRCISFSYALIWSKRTAGLTRIF